MADIPPGRFDPLRNKPKYWTNIVLLLLFTLLYFILPHRINFN